MLSYTIIYSTKCCHPLCFNALTHKPVQQTKTSLCSGFIFRSRVYVRCSISHPVLQTLQHLPCYSICRFSPTFTGATAFAVLQHHFSRSFRALQHSLRYSTCGDRLWLTKCVLQHLRCGGHNVRCSSSSRIAAVLSMPQQFGIARRSTCLKKVQGAPRAQKGAP